MGTRTRSAASKNTRGDPPKFVYRGRAIAHVPATGRSTFVSREVPGYQRTPLAFRGGFLSSFAPGTGAGANPSRAALGRD
jgi:hypothetical protein